MKAVVAAFNQEKALVGAFSVITNLRMELFEALLASLLAGPGYLAAICIHYYHLYADSVSMLSWNKGGRNKNQIYFILLYNREYNLNIALAGVMMQSVITTLSCRCTLHLHTIYTRSAAMQAHQRFRGIESRVLKICDFKKIIFSPFFKHNITGFGVLIPKRYHMLG